MKKQFWILICILTLLLASIWMPAGGVADGDHPITLTVTCDPDPELEEGGTVPDLLFTIRNTGTEDYTLENAVLSGGYEDRSLKLDETITVLAGATKEFHLTDVEIDELQLDTDITYVLSWEETEIREDAETGEISTVKHSRDTAAVINIPRFLLPELTVSATCSAERVRAGETFTVVYTIENDTKFDMSGLKLYDPEQSMQSIELPSADLYAGEQRSVEITYTMGKKDMSFKPAIEYVVKQREMVTQADQMLTIESIIVDVSISVQQYPTTKEGTSFAITVKNAGNRTVTDIRVYDEINTLIGDTFDLAPDQSKVLEYSVSSAASSGIIRYVQFHLRAYDSFGQLLMVTDPNQYTAAPYIDEDDVKLSLFAEIQKAYYDANGKLCASIRFEIRNYSDVTLHEVTLTETKLFGTVTKYQELKDGIAYYTTDYQLDGVKQIAFMLHATDPAGKVYETDEILMDLTNLKGFVEQSEQPVYVQADNPFFRDLTKKLQKPAMIAVFTSVSIAAVGLIVCFILYLVERRLKAKLPPAFEADMEKAMKKTQRRMENPLFKDAPTEQFGYTVPIKLRDYGELTEEEAEARRQKYAKRLRENLNRDAKAESAKLAESSKPAEKQNEEESTYRQTRIKPIEKTKSKTEEPDRNPKPNAEDFAFRKDTDQPSEPAADPEMKSVKKPDRSEKQREERVEPSAQMPESEQAHREQSFEPVKTALEPEQEPIASKPIPDKPKDGPIAPESIPDEPKDEPIVSESKPLELEEKPIAQDSIPDEPKDGPIAPESIPDEPEEEPIVSEPTADEPEEEPIDLPEEQIERPKLVIEPIIEPVTEEGEVPASENAVERMPFKPQLPSFLAGYISSKPEQEEAFEELSDAESEAAGDTPTRKESQGPRCINVSQLPKRRSLTGQTLKRMNG